jgi:ankyrin repeat protein
MDSIVGIDSSLKPDTLLLDFLIKNKKVSNFLGKELSKIEDVIKIWHQDNDLIPNIDIVYGNTILDAFKKLVEANGSKDKNETYLHVAATKGDTKIVQLFLSLKEIDVDAQDSNRWSPLHCAADSGHIETILALLEHKANINACDGTGATPIFLALNKENINLGVIRTLLLHDAKLNVIDSCDRTPLHDIILNEPKNMQNTLSLLLKYYPNYDEFIKKTLIDKNIGDQEQNQKVFDAISNHKKLMPSNSNNQAAFWAEEKK